MPTITRQEGLRYTTRFSCRGPDCEDTCCASWTAEVDEPYYRALEKRMSGTPGERAELRRALLPVVDGRSRERFAQFALRDDGRCAFLDEHRLCTLQSRYGEGSLANVCSIHPRLPARIGDRAELVATIGCPEIARLCLLAEDAVDVVPVEASRILRSVVYRALDDDAADPYERSFVVVRAAVIRLLSLPYPIESRLHFVAHLAHETAGDLRRGGAVDADHLDRALADVERPATLDALDRAMTTTEVTEPFALGVVSQVLHANRRSVTPGFRALIEAVYARHPGLTGDPAADAEALWPEHRRRKDELPDELRRRIELYLRNFCINKLFASWYVTDATSFVGWVQAMLVDVAVQRFLLLDGGVPVTLSELDARAVEVFYRYSRAMLHTARTGEALSRALEAQGMQTLRHSMLLIAT